MMMMTVTDTPIAVLLQWIMMWMMMMMDYYNNCDGSVITTGR